MAAIDNIVSLSKAQARILRQQGIRTTGMLLQRAGDRAGRRRLARETPLSESDLLTWAHRADLLRLKDLGPIYAELLGRSGVRNLRELSRRDPEVLWAKMAQVNERARLARRLPPASAVDGWVREAAAAQPVVRS